MDDQRGGNVIDRWNALSARQRECLELACRGNSSKEIARSLGVSPSTVDNHIQYALNKLGVTTRRDAARQLDRLIDHGRDRAPIQGVEKVRPLEQGKKTPGFRIALPPIGGSRNEGSIGQRVSQLIAVALLTLVVLLSTILAIAGAIRIAQMLV